VCLATICLDLRDATTGRVRFEEVRLRSRAQGPAAEYERVFGCRVRFAQPDDALVLPALDLRIRLRRRNRSVAERLERAAGFEVETLAQPTVRERVESILRATLPDGETCRRATVARRLVCSTRALRRALEAEGTSFREIEAQVRREVALALVSDTDLSLAEVAAHCGFAGLPAFSKAFRRWTVCAPSAFREMRSAAAHQQRSRRTPGVPTQESDRRHRDDGSPVIRRIARRVSS
jgi:AraC-like DNA-binding protein